AGPHCGRRPPIHGDRTTRVRGIGWEHVHVCIDDASRLAYSEVLATNQQHDALGFLERAFAWFAARGVRIAGVMTDNGAAYRAWSWAAACTRLGLRRLRTRPYTPHQRQARALHPNPAARVVSKGEPDHRARRGDLSGRHR